MSSLPRLAPCAAVLGAALLLTGCAATATEATKATSAVGLAACDASPTPSPPPVGQGLPGTVLPCLDGRGSTSLDSMVTGPAVVALWASWCGPCAGEMATLQAAYASENVSVVGVLTEDSTASGAGFARAMGVTFPSLVDRDGVVRRSYGVPGLPVTLFVASDGSVAYVHSGPALTVDSLRALLADHLGVAL